MKKMLLVLTVVLVGSLAASASAPVVVNFQFDGFCDNMQTIRYSPGAGFPKKFLTGIHDNSPCGGFVVAVGGFQHGLSTKIPPNVTPLNDYSDPIEGIYGLPYSLQYLVHESPCVWANYFSNSAANYLFLTGTCTRFSGAAPKKVSGTKSSVKR